MYDNDLDTPLKYGQCIEKPSPSLARLGHTSTLHPYTHTPIHPHTHTPKHTYTHTYTPPSTLPLGDAINDEMCYAFLTVVGQTAITECTDFPKGSGHPLDTSATQFCETVKDQWSNPKYMFCNPSAAGARWPCMGLKGQPVTRLFF